MNYYVLFVQTQYCERLTRILNGRCGIVAFMPRMEVYRRDCDTFVLEVMFPGYVFVKSELNQDEFDSFIMSLREEKKGFIRELKREDVSSLTEEEISFFENVLDDSFVLRMSYGAKIGARSIPFKGPLVKYTDHIVRVDFYRRLAYLDLKCMNRNIMVGFSVNKAK